MSKVQRYSLAIIIIAFLTMGLSYSKIFSGRAIYRGLDQERNEGYIAFIVNEEEADAIEPQPHPDANKCACKGTGLITHGDGHQTKCPYHEEPDDGDDNDNDKKHKCKCDTRRTYCNCVKAHGRCDCKKR